MTRRARRTLLGLGTIAVAVSIPALVIFHITLFWGRLADASITQPMVLLRWIGSAALIAGLLTLRRRVPHALLVFWLLVALLHIGVPSDPSKDLVLAAQIGLSAACGVLLSLAIGVTEAPHSKPAFLETPSPHPTLDSAITASLGRSPPAF